MSEAITVWICPNHGQIETEDCSFGPGGSATCNGSNGVGGCGAEVYEAQFLPAQPVLELVKAAQDLLDTPEPTALSLPDQEADWRAIRRRASAALSALEELLKEETE